MSPLKVCADEAEQAAVCADLFIDSGRQALGARGAYKVALSGGRGPRGLYRALEARRGDLDWGRVELYWVDERWVEPQSPESNYGEARRLWLDAWTASAGPVCHPMFRADLEPEAAADAYSALLSARVGRPWPVFDLALLGMGPDGHTASLFPGQPSLDERLRACLAVRQPASGQQRLTLTLPALNAARRCVFVLAGAEKAALLKRVLAGESDVPAARVRPAAGAPLWVADAAAAGAA